MNVLGIGSWRWYHVVVFWMGCLVILVGLIFVQLQLANASRWFLPYPGSIRGVGELLRALWSKSPVLAIELIGIPTVAIAVTIYWAFASSRS